MVRGVLVFAILASAGAARAAGDAPATDDATDQAYADAAARCGVPEALLRAVVLTESQGHMRAGEPTRDGRWGLAGLVPGTTLDRAAELTGLDPATLVTDPRANLLGAAAVLAELAAEEGSLEEALFRYAGLEYPAAGWDYAAHVIDRLGPLADYDALAAPFGTGFVPGGLPPPPFGFDTASTPDYPGATWVGPACSYRNGSRGWGDISFVVIHTCEGGFSGCWSWLRGCHGVSAHYVVSTAGEVVQVVEDEDVAWHVGCLNGESIGIEHEGSSSHPEDFTDAMYCASASLTRWLCDAHGIPRDRSHIIGHNEANAWYCGGDHWDPGPGWDWRKYMEYVECGCSGCCVPSPEVCNNRDDDCDGAVDEDLVQRCGTDVGECEFGSQRCSAGAWGPCTGGIDPVPELCDDLDNDCDAATDDDQVCEIEELVLQAALHDPAASSDVDGDGRADACARSSAGVECHLASGRGFGVAWSGPALPDDDGWQAPQYGSTLRLADIDGDGRADVCARASDGVHCWRSTGGGFGLRVAGPALSDADGWDGLDRFSTIRMADVDGDGRADLCARGPDGFRCHRSLGNGFGPPVVLAELSDAAGWDRLERCGTIRMGDVDGDGRDDLCARGADGVACWRSAGGGFGARIVGPDWSDARGWSAWRYWSTIRLADVDGDGRADLCGRSATDFRCHLATGTGFGDAVLLAALSDAAGWDRRERFSTIRLGDVDGDAAADVCARSGEGVSCWLWTGAGWGRSVPGPALSDAAGWSARAYYRTLRLADVSGDGRDDLCARGADGLRCWLADGNGFPRSVPGPSWSDADGWNRDARLGTIRIGGGGATGSPAVLAPAQGCACGMARPPGFGGFLAVALVVLCGIIRIRAWSRQGEGRTSRKGATAQRGGRNSSLRLCVSARACPGRSRGDSCDRGGRRKHASRLSVLFAAAVAAAAGCEVESGPGDDEQGIGCGHSGGVGKWHEPGPHAGPHILTCYGGCAPPHYDPTACGGGTACCSACIDGTWWYSTEQRNFGCWAKLEIRRGDRCVVVEVADNGPATWVEERAAGVCGGSGWIIDASPLVADYFGGGCGWSECFWVDVRQVDGSLPPGPCASCPCGCTPATEVCNGRDDDCDGAVDENRGPEQCNNRDDDCDGAVDEDLTQRCGTDVGECEFGTQRCSGGTWGACTGGVDPVPELCDDLDNDCDAATDDDEVCEIEDVLYRSGTDDPAASSDVDGDGRADACARSAEGFACHLASGRGFDVAWRIPELSDENGWDEPQHWSTIRTADIDGDGRADLCARAADGVRCWVSTGSGFGTRLAGPPLSDEEGWDGLPYYSTIRAADVDGDRRADLCARGPDGFRCYPSLGNGFGPPTVLAELSDAAGWDRIDRYGTLRLGDLDGDGRADLCARAADGVVCWLADGTGFGARVVGPAWSDALGWSALRHWSTIRLADVNGDGRADLCGRSADDFRCHPSTGAGFAGPVVVPELSDGNGWDRRERYATIRTGDVDGDGAADLCARGATGIDCWLWTGAGFGRRFAGPALSDDAGWDAAPRYRTIRPADVDGDGRADLCARAADGLRCWLADGTGFPRVVPGPPWSDEDGWNAPSRGGTIRLGAPAAGGVANAPPGAAAGCDCGVAGARRAGPLATAALLLLLGAGRRNRSPRDSASLRRRRGGEATDEHRFRRAGFFTSRVPFCATGTSVFSVFIRGSLSGTARAGPRRSHVHPCSSVVSFADALSGAPREGGCRASIRFPHPRARVGARLGMR